MTVALIVIGVVAFLVIDGIILAKVFGSHKAADDHGSIPVPGSIDLVLPAGKIKLTYQESRKAGSSENTIYFDMPGTVTVSVTPAGGGEPLPMPGPGFRGMGSNKSTRKGQSRDGLGKVEILTPGTYTVKAEGDAGPEAVEPQILIGK